VVDTRQQFDRLAGVYWPIAIAVFAIVVILLGVVVIRFRHRPGRAVSRRSEATRAELAYVLALAVVVGVLLSVTYPAESRIDRLAATPGLRIVATASDWNWRFDYPQQGVAEVGRPPAPTDLVVPVDATIEFDLRSTDVIHAFYIPERDFQRQALPGITNRFDLVFTRLGTLGGVCNEFCGLGHTEMRFQVHVLSGPAFAAWAIARRQGSAAL
jgi:cytochrome c oxidase subunit 2